MLVAIGRRLYVEGPKFENTVFEVDPGGRIVIDDQYNGPADNQALIKLNRSRPFCPISTWQRSVVDTLGSRLRELRGWYTLPEVEYVGKTGQDFKS